MIHFKKSDFDCKCNCGKNNMEGSTLLMLDLARERAGIPFIISSGTRCIKHNKEVGGRATSSHLKGYAVDIRYHTQLEMLRIAAALAEVGFKRVGVGNHFIHADNDPEKKEAKWIY